MAKKDKKSKIVLGDSGFPVMHEMFVPKAIFFTNGVGVHKDRLSSFELALRDAGIEKANLVTVSSIFPPQLQRDEPAKRARSSSCRGRSSIASWRARTPTSPIASSRRAIGLARPADKERYGYLSEHHSYGETAKKAGDYAEDLAATMLATTLGIEFDPEKAVERARAGVPPREDHPEDAQHRAERRGPRQGPLVDGHRLRRLHLLEHLRSSH